MGFLFFVIFAIATALSIAYALVPVFSTREARYDAIRSNAPVPAGRPRYRGFALALVFLLLAILSTGIRQINAGELGVVRRFGAVTGEVLQPGLTWVAPFVTSVDEVDTKVRSIRIADDPNTPNYEGYTAASKEQQDLFMNLTLNYHVDPGAAPTIVQNIGVDFESKIVLPRLLDIPKSVTDDYPTAIVLNSRDEIREKSTELLREALAPYGFVVDNIAIENFSYSNEYNASIEQKQIAQQQVETEKQKTEQQKQIAQQRIEESKGLAEAQIERARGEAEANRLVAASLTQEILLNRYIEKLAPGVQTVIVPSGNGTILNLGDLLKPPASNAPASPAP